MIRLVLLITITFCLNICYGQHNFLTTRISLTEIKKHEDSIESKKLGFIKTNVAEEYFPSAKANKDYYPLTYIRTNDSFFPNLQVQYFYDEKDSTLLSASYDWDIMNYVKNLKTDGSKFDIEIKRENDYVEKYKAIKEQLTEKFGNPISTEENTTNDGLFYRLKWTNETLNILVLLKFSRELKQFPGNMKIGSYAIRVKFDYKK